MMTDIERALHEYWEKRGPSYYVPDVFGRRIVAAYLVKLHPQSLIEVGCGNGELFSSFQHIPRVVAVDWSENMLQRAKERIDRHEYKNIALGKCDITNPADTFISRLLDPFLVDILPDRPYELALTRTVLMHIDPEKIEAACRNLTLLSDDIVIMEYYGPGTEEKLAWHNWHHEYVHLFKPLSYELIDSYDRPDGIHQILFHFRRTRDAAGDPGSLVSDVPRHREPEILQSTPPTTSLPRHGHV